MEGKTGTVFIRVYSDLLNIGYYSILHRDECITFLPIVERKKLRSIPSFLNPRDIIDPCTGDPLYKYYRYTRYYVNAVHYDPRIDLGFYTEEYKGRRLPVKKIKKKDLILFISGLAKYPEDLWKKKEINMNKILYDLKKKKSIGIYIVGGIYVDKIIYIRSSDWDSVIEKYSVLYYSPHYYRLNDRDSIGVIGKSFYVKPPIPIAYLTLKGYRLTRYLIDLMGYSNAVKFSRQNFRKSRYILIDDEKLMKNVLLRADYR